MNEQKLKDLAAECAKGIKTEDLNQFTRLLSKITVETALNAELAKSTTTWTSILIQVGHFKKLFYKLKWTAMS